MTVTTINLPQTRPPLSPHVSSSPDEMVASNYGRLYRWFLWLTNNSADAADLTQDTFVAMWQSLDRFRAGSPLTPWLFGIARNVWRNHRSSQERRGRISGGDQLLDQVSVSAPGPEETMLSQEAIALLERSVAELSPDYREAVVLRFWEELGYDEIAQTLSITEGLARWRVHQARKQLSERLADTGAVREQAFRAGGKLSWWMRTHRRPGAPADLLERCMATIPSATRPLPLPQQHAAPPAASNGDHHSPAPAPAAAPAQPTRVATLDELRQAPGSCRVVRHDGRNVAVFHHNGAVRAVENRCPHMGFPLHRGSVSDGILTCFWHHARFDLASGCTFDLWADDVATYPIEMRDGGEVWLLPRPPRDEAAHWQQRLREGMQHDLWLVTAKAVLGLLRCGVDPAAIVRQVALFGACYRDDWGDGLTILTANARLLHHLEPEQRFLPLWHGAVRVSKNQYEAKPHWDRRPLGSDDVEPSALRRWLRHWVSVRHRDAAERCLLTALANGADAGAMADLLLSAATDRIYADLGHIVDFINKALEMASLIGWEHAPDILPTLTARLIGSRGGEESSVWRQPVDLVVMLRQLEEELPAVMDENRQKQHAPDTDIAELLGLSDVLLGDDPERILSELKRALQRGVAPVDLAKLLAYAAAMRVYHFGTANEFADWIAVLHTFTYCNAVHQLLKRIGSAASPQAVRAVFHGALRIYLDRFLNVPPAQVPDERGGARAAEDPTNGSALLSEFLDTLDCQARVDSASRIVARYLHLRHPVEPLIQTLTRAVMREDAEFHTYQVLEAAVQQYEEWRGTPQADRILTAAARYIAAHAPSQREMLQTAEIALRLGRGECLHEANCAGT